MRSIRAKRKLLQTLLKKVRGEAGMNQADLALRLGKPQSFVSKYESGERRLDIIEVMQICEILGIKFKTFISRLQKLLSA